MVNWKAFNKFEIEEKRRMLKKITVKQSYDSFKKLVLFNQQVKKEKSKKLDEHRLKELIGWRKKMDSLEVS